MKTIFITAFLTLLVSCRKENSKEIFQPSANPDRSAAQTVSAPADSSDPADSIRKEYNRLHALLEAKKLTTKGFTYNCNEEPSGEVTFYSDKGEIKVIRHSYAEHSHFSAVEQYFIKNGKPFFIFREEAVWSFDGGTSEKHITKDDITETRIYIQNGKPIRCLEKIYSIRSDGSEKPDPAKIPGKEIPCTIEGLMKTYELLIKNKDQKEKKQCL